METIDRQREEMGRSSRSVEILYIATGYLHSFIAFNFLNKVCIMITLHHLQLGPDPLFSLIRSTSIQICQLQEALNERKSAVNSLAAK